MSLEPWKKKEKLVLADSYFASVQAAMVLKSEPWGLDFIGNVKTCTQQFPMKYLDAIVMGRRGDRHALLASLDETGTYLHLALVSRHFLISRELQLSRATANRCHGSRWPSRHSTQAQV